MSKSANRKSIPEGRIFTGARSSLRSAKGQQLVEVIVAVAVSGFIAVMMGASLAQLMATSTGSENQLKAQDVAKELLERLRRTPYNQIATPAAQGNYDVQVYSDDGVTPGSMPFQASPLLADITNYTWSAPAIDNRFRGPGPNGYATVTVNLQTYPSSNNGELATITITWAENQAQRTLVLTSVITNDGIHN